MSSPPLQPGQVGWIDLTVADADDRRDFYAAVVGWTPQECPMDGGSYADYAMAGEDGTPYAGVCHDRGTNAGLPAVWLPYFVVEDVDARLAEARARGAELLSGPRGNPAFAILRDPGGASFGIVAAAPTESA